MKQMSNTRTAGTRRGGTATIVVASVLVLGAGFAVAAYLMRGNTESEADIQGTTEVIAAEQGSFEITTLATGELEARNRIELRSQLLKPGTIMEIVPEGSIVKAGDVLVRLNGETIADDILSEELALAEAQADLLAAQTALDIQSSENESRLRKAELQIILADLALQQWLSGEVESTRKDQQLQIEQAERQLKRLEAKFERSEELLALKFISKDERDLDQIAFIDAQAKLEVAKLNQRVYEEYQFPRDQKQKQSDLDEAKAELERVKQENDINISSQQATVSNRERQVARRETRLNDLRKQLEACTVIAPSGGLVVYGTTVQSDNFRSSNEGPLQVGRTVSPNDLLIVLPDVSEMVARVRVHESVAGRIRPGQTATIKVDAMSQQTFTGSVVNVGVLAEVGGWRDPNRREYTVRIALDPNQNKDALKPSMRCEARILLGSVEDVVHVPIQSVFMDGPVTYVYAPRGPRFERMPVQLGRRSETRAEIAKGLESGQRVLLRRPTPGEVVSEPWDQAELVAVGYTLDEAGNPVASSPAGRGGGMPAGVRPAGIPNATGAPRGAPGGAAPAAAAKPETKEEPATTSEASESDATKKVSAPAAVEGTSG